MFEERDKINIPLPCPKCGGRLYSTTYKASWNILKRRVWHVCKDCDYEREVDDFKNQLLTV